MKSTLKLFAMLMLVTFMASCSEGSDELGTTQSTGKKVYMTFSGSTDATLRTVIKDNTKIDFVANDAISVFDVNKTNNEFTTTEGGSQAQFEGYAVESESYTFLYPYQEGATFAEDKINAVIPVEQTATEGSFDPAANLSVATGNGKSVVNLKNVCSLIRLNVAVNCASVTLTDLDGRAVAGAVTINPATGEATPAATGASKSVTLKNLEAGKIYYIAILPGAIKLFLEFRTSAYEGFIKSKASQITLERSKVLNVGQVVSSPKEEWVEIADLKWATCNVGASSETAIGDYFKNGEATAVNLGSFWRVPTAQELKNLTANSLRVITEAGATFYPLKGKNLTYSTLPGGYKYLADGPCIFLPSTGYTLATGVQDKETGYYWSSDKKLATALHFTTIPSVTVTTYGTGSGMCIRPIYVSPISSVE